MPGHFAMPRLVFACLMSILLPAILMLQR